MLIADEPGLPKLDPLLGNRGGPTAWALRAGACVGVFPTAAATAAARIGAASDRARVRVIAWRCGRVSTQSRLRASTRDFAATPKRVHKSDLDTNFLLQDAKGQGTAEAAAGAAAPPPPAALRRRRGVARARGTPPMARPPGRPATGASRICRTTRRCR